MRHLQITWHVQANARHAHRGSSVGHAVSSRSRLARLLRDHSRLGNSSPAVRRGLRFETCRSALVFNGEIYNRRHPSAALQGLDAKFHTSSDTEVVWWEIVQ